MAFSKVGLDLLKSIIKPLDGSILQTSVSIIVSFMDSEQNNGKIQQIGGGIWHK